MNGTLMKNTSTLTRTASRPERVSSTLYIDVGGTNIRYIEMGRDNPGPVLVMLHGYRAGGDYWYPHTLPGMASAFHVIAPDLPGFGYSARMPDMTLAGYADKV